jgi:hypothetical protein
MRYIKYVLLLVIVFTSCKIKKSTVDSGASIKELSIRKVLKKHASADFNKKTIAAKFKVDFEDNKMKQSISVSLKIKKDEVIWLKGTKFINVFKAKITPEGVQFYSPIEKIYFEGDFSVLEKLLGIEINFQQLQNLFLGQSIIAPKKERQKVAVINNLHVVTPLVQASLFDVFFAIDPLHFKLSYQSIINTSKRQRLDINYPSYTLVEDAFFPELIKIKAKRNKEITSIDFNLKSIVFDVPIDTSFTIPKGYKRMNL